MTAALRSSGWAKRAETILQAPHAFCLAKRRLKLSAREPSSQESTRPSPKTKAPFLSTWACGHFVGHRVAIFLYKINKCDDMADRFSLPRASYRAMLCPMATHQRNRGKPAPRSNRWGNAPVSWREGSAGSGESSGYGQPRSMRLAEGQGLTCGREALLRGRGGVRGERGGSGAGKSGEAAEAEEAD